MPWSRVIRTIADGFAAARALGAIAVETDFLRTNCCRTHDASGAHLI